MKNIFDSKDEKITEKAFVQSVVISVVGILLCIVALCSATFCWFTGETESNSNTLVSGTFDVTISVTATDANKETADEVNTETADGTNTETAGDAQGKKELAVTAHDSREGVWVCQITQPGKYAVTLTLKDGATVKGHCIVSVGNDSPRHTAAIIGEHTANEANAPLSNPFTFTFEVTEASEEKPVTVTFEPLWGVVVKHDIPNGGVYPATVTDQNGADADAAS